LVAFTQYGNSLITRGFNVMISQLFWRGSEIFITVSFFCSLTKCYFHSTFFQKYSIYFFYHLFNKIPLKLSDLKALITAIDLPFA